MNYTARITRVFAHGANISATMSIPGTNEPIVNSETGSLESDFETNGTTYSTQGNFTKRVEPEDPYSCEKLSPTPKKFTTMEDNVAK
jgi:hypothetical protein